MKTMEFNNVTAGYESVPVIHNVSMEIRENESVAIIGHNGVGKTTLMKTAIGLLEPNSGSIKYDNKDITDMKASSRANIGIGYVSQKRDVFDALTVEENLEVGKLVNNKTDDTYLDEVYGYFPRLDERRDQKAGSMSGGEQQMLAIGRALVGGPDLLLLDEPSEGVQPSIISEISENISLIKEELGMAVLFAEQHLEFIKATADRCYMMEKGQITKKIDGEEMKKPDTIKDSLSI